MPTQQGWYRSALAGVIAFSIFSGVISGFMIAGGFLPVLSVQQNSRKWYPGFEQVTQVGTVTGKPDSLAIEATELPFNRLWRRDKKIMQAGQHALIAHGLWREGRYSLGDLIQISTATGNLSLPIAGIWQPFHPQLGDQWLVIVGSDNRQTFVQAEIPAPGERPGRLPRAYSGSNMLSFWLFNSIIFSIFALIGLVGRKGHSQLLGWAAKLWVGALTAIFTGLIVSALAFSLTTFLPVLDLLPMTFMMLIGSYFSAALVMTGVCLAMTRL